MASGATDIYTDHAASGPQMQTWLPAVAQAQISPWPQGDKQATDLNLLTAFTSLRICLSLQDMNRSVSLSFIPHYMFAHHNRAPLPSALGHGAGPCFPGLCGEPQTSVWIFVSLSGTGCVPVFSSLAPGRESRTGIKIYFVIYVSVFMCIRTPAEVRRQ